MLADQVIEEEDLAGNAARMGLVLKEELSSLNPDIVTTLRGRGLLWAIVIKESDSKLTDLLYIGVSCCYNDRYQCLESSSLFEGLWCTV